MGEKKSFLENTEKVNHWVSQEFSEMVNIISNTLKAKRTLENLIEDRSLLAKEHSKLKESIEAPNLQKEEKNKIKAQIKSLDEDLELRSTQIVNLKQKLQSLNSYQENKSKSRWDCIQTMADAKIALNYVFETAITLHKDKPSKESALHELQESYNSVVSQLTEKEELRQEIPKLKKAENKFTDKEFMLLNKVKETTGSNESQDLPLQDLSNANNVSEEDAKAKAIIQQQQMRIEELERQLEKHKVSKAKTSRSENQPPL